MTFSGSAVSRRFLISVVYNPRRGPPPEVILWLSFIENTDTEYSL
jgi:hypothetical protein